MEDYIAQVRAAKKNRTIISIIVGAVVILTLLWIFIRPDTGPRELTEEVALSRAPVLALTEDELALARTILDDDDFRNALSYDLVDNTTVFAPEDVQTIVASVIPAEAKVGEIGVSGALVYLDYTLPQYRVILQFADADRSGSVDLIRKTLTPIINGISTGCYTVEKNLVTDKITYTYMKF